ncbi:MAG: hypothetical protein JSU91_02965 [Thermoplasmatales archaeon]|nr:MAG: hypothetical protein JSU91_02965 [Thermoplasmatales archaeon]
MSIRTRKIDAIIIIAMIIIAGFIFYRLGYIFDSDGPDIPDIQFKKDDQEKTLTVVSLSDEVLWIDIEIIGDCDTSELGKYVIEGDLITQCEGTITIRHIPTDTTLSIWKFTPIENLPYSMITGHLRDVSPQDEGAHFNNILNTREWWYYTVIFDEESELPGWSVTIGFCHMAWGDLRLTLKPDILVITLHSPDGKEYGGLINKKRGGILGLGILGTSGLDASTPGVDLKFEDSWVKGEAPIWHVHAEDNEIDEENEIEIDLDYFAPSSPLWLYSSRVIDKGEGSLATYMFTGCEVSGTIKLNGLEFEVSGIGHHEHSWSIGFIKWAIKGWDWCHIRLDNGWNILYNKYYLRNQLLEIRTTRVNPISSLIITTDKGETLTILEDLDITVRKSDRIFLLLKMPSELNIRAKPNTISQILLKKYNIRLDLDIEADNTYEKIWKFPTYVGMKIGLSTIDGKISWNDEDGDHEIELTGIGSIWNMRKF